MNEHLYSIIRLFIIGSTETWWVHFSLVMLTGYEPKMSLKYAGALSVYFAATVFDAYNDFPIYFVFTLAYVIIFLIMHFFYNSSEELKIGMPFVSISLNYSATLFASTVIRVVKGGEKTGFSLNLRQNISSQILLIIIAVFMVFLLRVIGRNRKMDTKAYEVSNILSILIIPFSIVMVIINTYYLSVSLYHDSPDMEINNIKIGTLLLFISMTFYFLTANISRFTEAKDYSNTLEQMIQMQAKYYNDLEKHQIELRKINHDIKNHTRVMNGLINVGRIDELREYIDIISDYVTGVVSPVTNCDNMLINALLNEKLGSAKQNGVDLELCVMVPAELEINNVDMCIIVGNLLDNAVDACSNMTDSEDKYIHVDIRIMNSFLIIKVENTYNVPIQMSGNEYVTTKRDKNSHGLGMKNIRRVVEKYNGRLDIRHTDRVFTAVAYLTYPEADA